MDGLVDDIVWLEDIVVDAVAVILLLRALVDAPVAIDDELECHVSRLYASLHTAAEARRHPCRIHGQRETYLVLRVLLGQLDRLLEDAVLLL